MYKKYFPAWQLKSQKLSKLNNQPMRGGSPNSIHKNGKESVAIIGFHKFYEFHKVYQSFFSVGSMHCYSFQRSYFWKKKWI